MKVYFEKLYKGTQKDFLTKLYYYIENEQKRYVITANPEIFMLADRQKEMHKYLMSPNSIIVPDGIGIVVGGRMLGFRIHERIPGVEICGAVLNYASKNKKSIYLFGAKPEVVNCLVSKIKEEYPNIVICGYKNGYIKDKELAVEEIHQKRPDIVLVALGAPQQELFISRHEECFEKGIFIGVGGSFDVLSGYKKRAPRFFVEHNLEWLYRIISEPKRLKRFWNNNVMFLLKVCKKRLGR